MDLEPIIVGTIPNDGTGDPLRVVGTKANGNFAAIRTAMATFDARLTDAEDTLVAPVLETGTTSTGSPGTQPVATIRPGDALNSYALDLVLPPVTTSINGLTDITQVGRAVALATVRAVTDNDITIAATDTFVSVKPLTASRTVLLPNHATYPVGVDLVITDGSGACSDTLRINIGLRSGAPILGASPPIFLASPGASVRLRLIPTRDAWIFA